MANSDQRMRVHRFEEPAAASLGPRTPKPRRKLRRWPFVVAGGLALIALVLAGGAAYLGRDTGVNIPEGTRIDGVAVGGMTTAAALTVVRSHGSDLVARGVIMIVGGNRFQIDPATIDLRPNAAAAVRAAQGKSSFLERLQGRLGSTTVREIPLTYLFNNKSYLRATLPMRQAVDIAPQSAAITTNGSGAFIVTPAVDGQRISATELRRALRNVGHTGPEIVVPTVVVSPLITTTAATATAEQARTYVSTRHAVTLGGDTSLVPKGVILRSAGIETERTGLRFVISRGVLRAYFGRVYGKAEKPARNATFTTNRQGKARIIGGRNGRGVDVEALVRVWEQNPEQRVVPITVGMREPALTNSEAQNMGIKQIVGQFFTPYNGGPRVSNIERAAEILDQFIIPAHGRFSLNEALGERTLARGFVEAPMIGDDNILEDVVGGGISQISTTVFNAAFFSGLKLIAHTPHSFWISRYPMGREATVSWGGPELVFENNWDAPIVILTHTNDEGVTVQFLSDPLGRRVEAVEGTPHGYKKARMLRTRDKSLAPGELVLDQKKGENGFKITYGRKIYRNSKLIASESWRWRYAPANGIIRVGPRVPVEPVVPGIVTDGVTDASTTETTTVPVP